jgi:uncharacterized membrane protein
MRRAAGWVWKTLAILALVGYQYLVHLAVSGTQAGFSLRLALVLLLLLALALWVVVRFTNKPLWLGALLLIGVVAYLLEQRESVGLLALNGMSHAAAYLILLMYFGRTLAGSAEPLITKFARRVHGTLLPAMEAYTRRLTVAWCVFFAAQIVVSALLYLFAPLDAWSIFVNLLNLPLMLLMFFGEGVYRVARHPEHPRATLEEAIRAYHGHSPVPKASGAP